MYLCVGGIDVIVTTSWVVTITAIPLTHKIHDRSLSWVVTITSIPLTHKYMTVHFPGLLQSHLSVRGIAVIVTTHESERSCICVLEVSLLPLSRFSYCILEYSVVFLVSS
jgi:hypothetical protein